MTAVCSCNAWALVNFRIGYPNGHHPRCPQQPHPSRIVELKCSNEFLAEAVLKLHGARVIDTRISADLNDHNAIKFTVDMPGAPDHAISMEPTYTSRRWPDGGQRDYYLSGITWHLADGTTQVQTFTPPKSEGAMDE